MCDSSTMSTNLLSFAEYMLEHLHIEENEVPKMCLDLYREYGTTMAGLKVWRFGSASFFSSSYFWSVHCQWYELTGFT